MDREKAVVIARDVLANLDAFRFVDGYYFAIPGNSYWEQFQDDLQQHVEKVTCDCEVCLLGACLLAKAKLYNEVKLKNLITGDRQEFCSRPSFVERKSVLDHLKDIFDPFDLDLMEVAFEGTKELLGLEVKKGTEEIMKRAVKMGNAYDNHWERTRAIMENIIDNNGRFIP